MTCPLARLGALLCGACFFTSTAAASGPDAPDSARVLAKVQDIAAQAGGMVCDSGQALLPPETVVDRAEWQGNVLRIDLTVAPAAGRWQTGLHQIEEISEAFAAPFMVDPSFGGTIIRVRGDVHEPYGGLEDFAVFNAPAPPPDSSSADDVERRVEAIDEAEGPPAGEERGPVTQSSRQPTGALSGVVVYCAGGHGWTAGASSWGLQRPILHVMNEDYGNLEQLNYFVHYAYNAGATVVPFRPVGYQDIEIVLDNDDPGVTFTGSWVNATGALKYYEDGDVVSGVPYKEIARSASQTATARYTPTIVTSGFYPVYCFVESDADRCPQTYRIRHSGGTSEVVVEHRRVGNGWVWLGEYHLEAGGETYVEITNQASSGGVVVADAIRWGNGIGDVPRTPSNVVSGFGRDEECQRYWAHSELGNNAVGFSAAQIWDSSDTDLNDNVSAAGRWAREMNFASFNNERWRRVYLEFHSNAANTMARGTIALVSDSLPTTNQLAYATILGDEVEADMLIADADFEHLWIARSNPFLGAFGAISTGANSNEFDATILEVAFHDNQMDAELMRDPRVRAALARASVHGLIRFLNTLAGSQVPIAFPPDTPRDFRAVDASGGQVTLAWTAPLSDGARGDPATGYAIYQSANGYGYTLAATVGNVTSTTIPGLPVGQTLYYRVAATNAGGESMPSEALAVRRRPLGPATVLMVNGFDRQRRQQNPTESIGGVIERPLWRRSNSFDYVIQHAQALAATGAGFDSCTNEAIIAGQVLLGDYDIVVWILGEESTQDDTFDATEQVLTAAYLSGGGMLFLSGAEIGWDLDAQNNGRTFYESTLGANYVGDDANTFNVTGTAGGIFADVAAFDFDPANGAPYLAEFPDQIAAQPGGQAALTYVGGSGGTAAVTFDAGAYRVVQLGFPFELITSALRRTEIMARAIDYLGGIVAPVLFDADFDGDVDLADQAAFNGCMMGPDNDFVFGDPCLIDDADADSDVDLQDYAGFQQIAPAP